MPATEAASAHITPAQDLKKDEIAGESPQSGGWSPTQPSYGARKQSPRACRKQPNVPCHGKLVWRNRRRLVSRIRGAKATPGTNQNTRSEVLCLQRGGHCKQRRKESTFIGAYAPPGGGQELLTITSANGDVLGYGQAPATLCRLTLLVGPSTNVVPLRLVSGVRRGCATRVAHPLVRKSLPE